MLIDYEGHIVHIDFGFMLTTSPGSINFESAPFKFTAVNFNTTIFLKKKLIFFINKNKKGLFGINGWKRV